MTNKWQEYVRNNPPTGASQARKHQVRQEVKQKFWVRKGDHCFVCHDDRIEALRKHHLLPVGLYADRKDINDHLLCLCQNCHDITHALIIGDRQGVSWQTVQRLKESGHWSKFVEIDRITVEAAKGKKSDYCMRVRC